MTGVLVQAGDVAIETAGLSPEAAQSLLAARTRLLAEPPSTAAPARSMPVLLAGIGGTTFAVALSDLRAVTRPARLTAVPGGTPTLIGLFSRDGIVHSLFDVRAILGVGTADRVGQAPAVVLRRPGPAVAIAVDALIGTATAEPGRREDEAALTHFVPVADNNSVPLLHVPTLLTRLGLRPV